MKVQDRIDLFVKKFGFMPEAYEICPKWEYCSCNKCPLHKDYSKLEIKPEDKTKKCRCPKQIRKQIGMHFKLKSMGLTLKEVDSMKKSIRMKKEALSTQEKNAENPITAQEGIR